VLLHVFHKQVSRIPHGTHTCWKLAVTSGLYFWLTIDYHLSICRDAGSTWAVFKTPCWLMIIGALRPNILGIICNYHPPWQFLSATILESFQMVEERCPGPKVGTGSGPSLQHCWSGGTMLMHPDWCNRPIDWWRFSMPVDQPLPWMTVITVSYHI